MRNNKTPSTRNIGRAQQSRSRGDMIAGDEVGRSFFRRLKKMAIKTAVSYGANAVLPGSGAVAANAVSGDEVGMGLKSVKKLAKNKKLQMGVAAATGATAVIAAQKAYKSDTGKSIKATIKKKYASLTAPSEKVTLSRAEYEKLQKGGKTKTKTEIKYVTTPATAAASTAAAATASAAESYSDIVTDDTASTTAESTDAASTADDAVVQTVKSFLPASSQTADVDASAQKAGATPIKTSDMIKKYAPLAVGGIIGVIVLKKVLGK